MPMFETPLGTENTGTVYDDLKFTDWVEMDVRNELPLKYRKILQQPENLLYWLDVLKALSATAVSHTQKEQSRLDELKPIPGKPATEEYMAARAAVKKKQALRSGFVAAISMRMAEVKALIRKNSRVWYKEDLIKMLNTIADVLEEKGPERALDLIETILDDIDPPE